ncbi:MAG TPA: DUF711 family protein [Povalibacter sp.]|uniref:DUF711 family protein n=1 Tax=Povalibacter sp. TaxID=1962978 RepID=UPI002CA18525|nr:DUF711 family protein [Povalibacter sp.]HMN45232.1 DUF711 family protein [Povalibacter sp.]
MNALRIRPLTAGIELPDASRLDAIEAATALLQRARRQFGDAGYEVQTVRIATQPFVARMDAAQRNRLLDQLLDQLRTIDALLADTGTIMSLGPVMTDDRNDSALAEWAAELVREDRQQGKFVAL